MHYPLSLIWFAGVFILLLGGCADKPPGGEGSTGKKAKDERFPVEVAAVAERSLTPMITANGSLLAFETVRITARVAGILDQLLVSEGDEVSQGQSIAIIDGERYRLAVAQAESQFHRAETAHAIARRNADRRQELAKQDLVRAEELDQAKSQVDQAEADVIANQVALDKARLDLRDATVLAPIAGVIQERLTSRGSYLQIGTGLATLVQRDPLQVRFPLTVVEATHLSSGQPVTVKARGVDGTFPGVIRFLSASADSGTRMVPCLATVDDPAHRLRPGSFAEITVPIPPRTAPAVPELALRTSERGLLAYVVSDGKLVERVVVPGSRGADGMVEIRQGLTVGETVVVRASDGLENGLVVRVVEPSGSLTAPRGSGRSSAASESDLQSLSGGR